jgi:hypothetical protein
MARKKDKLLTKAIKAVEKEYRAATSRQKPGAKKPSGCMRGLEIALSQMKGLLHEG